MAHRGKASKPDSLSSILRAQLCHSDFHTWMWHAQAQTKNLQVLHSTRAQATNKEEVMIEWERTVSLLGEWDREC